VEREPILLGNAHHLRDDRQGQGKREVGEQVDGLLLLGRVEQLADDLLHRLLHLLDPPGGEGLVHQIPQAAVIGGVGGEHVALEGPEQRRHPPAVQWILVPLDVAAVIGEA
jgi:hypothetical protein